MAVAVAVLCGGCVGRQSKEASVAPVAQVGSEYNQHQDQIAAVEPWEESWWRSFNDTVLDALIEDGLVASSVGNRDKRERHLHLTQAGAELERALSDAQRDRMRAAYRSAGPEAVAGFRQVLEAMMNEDARRHYEAMKDRTE